MMRAESEVNAATRRQRISGRNGSNGDLREIEQFQEASQGDAVISAFPYLEKIGMVAKKNPYAMLTIIVSIASVVIIAVTTLAVSVLGSVFVMYGTMSRLEEQQTAIIRSLDENKNELKVLRTYEASVLSRQNFMAGQMTERQQQRLNEYDRANPLPRLPKENN